MLVPAQGFQQCSRALSRNVLPPEPCQDCVVRVSYIHIPHRRIANDHRASSVASDAPACQRRRSSSATESTSSARRLRPPRSDARTPARPPRAAQSPGGVRRRHATRASPLRGRASQGTACVRSVWDLGRGTEAAGPVPRRLANASLCIARPPAAQCRRVESESRPMLARLSRRRPRAS